MIAPEPAPAPLCLAIAVVAGIVAVGAIAVIAGLFSTSVVDASVSSP